MEFREVRSLVALGKLKSIAKTAVQMNLTPAAVHKQLKNLEAEFGFSLYEKTGRGIFLTPAAEMLLPHLDDLVSQYEAIFSVATEWKGLKRGFVRIGSNPAVSTFLAPPLLRAFREQLGGVTVMLDVDSSGGLLERVTNRSLDLAFGLWTQQELADSASRARWAFEMIVVTNDSRLPTHARLQDLSPFPYIRLPAGSALSNAIDAYSDSHGLRPSEIMIVNNSHTIISMVRAGLGCAMIPRWAVAAEIQSGALRVVEQLEPPLITHLSLLTAKTRYVSPQVAAFIDLARGHAWDSLRLVE